LKKVRQELLIYHNKQRENTDFFKTGLILAITGNENGHLAINKEFLEKLQFYAFYEMHKYSLEK
jgi:tRNA U34 2-thiouridine synthase MnmA/TrmU